MADNDNTSQQPLPSQGTPSTGGPSSMDGVRRTGRHYAGIRVNFDAAKAPTDGPSNVNTGLEANEPDVSGALVLSSQILHPVPDTVTSRIQSTATLRNVWMVGQAPDLLPGTLVIRNNQPAAEPDQEGAGSLNANNERKPAGPDTGASRNPLTAATPKADSGTANVGSPKPIVGPVLRV